MQRVNPQGIVTEKFKRAVQAALKGKGMTYKQFCESVEPHLDQAAFTSWITGHMKNRKREQEFIGAIRTILGV
jgi:hypothetical protein